MAAADAFFYGVSLSLVENSDRDDAAERETANTQRMYAVIRGLFWTECRNAPPRIVADGRKIAA